MNGLYKTECIGTTIFYHSLYKTIADVEYDTAGWIDWYNNRMLHGSLGMVSPNEFEADHYATLTRDRVRFEITWSVYQDIIAEYKAQKPEQGKT